MCTQLRQSQRTVLLNLYHIVFLQLIRLEPTAYDTATKHFKIHETIYHNNVHFLNISLIF